MRLISDTKKNDQFEPLNFIQVSIADKKHDLLMKSSSRFIRIIFFPFLIWR